MGGVSRTLSCPADGQCRPSSIRKSVVFPAPLGPMTATNSPGRTSKVASFQTTLSR